MRTLLIDADIVAYKVAAAEERAVEWDPGRWTVAGDLDEAVKAAHSYLTGLTERLEADAFVLAFSDDANFRKDLYPAYKTHRAPEKKPILLAPLKARMEETHVSYRRPGLEGDDVLGILLTSPRIIKGEKILVSLDKDMKCLPGLHVRMGETDIREVSGAEADRWHMLQTLAGDRTDGYPGCPGIGMKKAGALLEPGLSLAALWRVVVDTYAKAKLSVDVALTQARVARILRNTDYDFPRKEVKLWTPPA